MDFSIAWIRKSLADWQVWFAGMTAVGGVSGLYLHSDRGFEVERIDVVAPAGLYEVQAGVSGTPVTV